MRIPISLQSCLVYSSGGQLSHGGHTLPRLTWLVTVASTLPVLVGSGQLHIPLRGHFCSTPPNTQTSIATPSRKAGSSNSSHARLPRIGLPFVVISMLEPAKYNRWPNPHHLLSNPASASHSTSSFCSSIVSIAILRELEFQSSSHSLTYRVS